MTVKEVVEKVLAAACGDKRLEKTCDQLMIGDWNNEVTGIATTFIVTPDVVRAAEEQGCNLIITHEPTWFTGADQTVWCEKDPVYLAKRGLLEEAHMNVWRFHDHMHMAGEDLIYDGLIKELDWEAYHAKGMNKWCYDIPSTTLEGLVKELKSKLEMNTLRVVGDPQMPCSRVGILVGGGSLGLGVEEMPMQFMESAKVEVMLCGDITEWTLCSYVNDASQLGLNKAMIVVGHERTEEAGMKHLADWLKPVFPEMNIVFTDAKEPFKYL